LSLDAEEKYCEFIFAVMKIKNFFYSLFRDAVDIGNYLEKTVESYNCVSQWRRFIGLSNEGGSNGDASCRRTKQSGGGENAIGVGRQPELQGYEGPDAALL